MKNQKSTETTYQDSFIASIASDEVKSVALEYGELAIDGLLSNMLLDNEAITKIPFIGTVVGAAKGALGVRDYFYVRKVAKFLFQISSIPEPKREKYKQKIAENPEEISRVGITILEIIDKLNSDKKAIMVGKLFQAYLDGSISTDQLVLLAEMVERAYLQDIESVVRSEVHNTENLIHVGIKNPRDFLAILDRNSELANSGIGTGTSHMRDDTGFTDAGYELMRILRSY